MGGPMSTEENAIAQATATLLDGVNNSRLDRVLSVWSGDGVLMPPNHPAVHGRAAIEDYSRALFERARFTFVFTESVISIEANIATERLSYTATVWLSGSTTPVADRGKGLHVYRRQADGVWKLAVDVWNSDLPRP